MNASKWLVLKLELLGVFPGYRVPIRRLRVPIIPIISRTSHARTGVELTPHNCSNAKQCEKSHIYGSGLYQTPGTFERPS
jgi:hypothetical protein